MFSWEKSTALGKIIPPHTSGPSKFLLPSCYPTSHQKEQGQVQSHPPVSLVSYLAGTWGDQEGLPGLDPQGALESGCQTAPC